MVTKHFCIFLRDPYQEQKDTLIHYLSSPVELMGILLEHPLRLDLRFIEIYVKDRWWTIAGWWKPRPHEHPYIQFHPDYLEDPEYVDELAGRIWEIDEDEIGKGIDSMRDLRE